MLAKVHYMIEHMRGAKPVISTSNKNEIGFPKMGSNFYIGTAGAKKFGRGDTINFLHCSEVAFWEDAKGLLSGLFQAVPKSGEISLESTGNGKGNYYHRATMRAANNESAYRLHFLPWHTFDEYQYVLSEKEEAYFLEHLIDEYDEPKLLQFGLTIGQLAWRRDKIEELDFDLNEFKQEYPMTLDECFQATGRSIFAKINYEPTELWQRLDGNTFGLTDHPKRGYHYAIGGDVAAGVGGRSSIKNEKGTGEGDRSTLEVFCLETNEQVAEYANNAISPDVFGKKAASIGETYNNAYINLENNNHGIVAVKVLLDSYPNHLVNKRPRKGAGVRDEVDKITDFGYRTSVKSKPFALGQLRHGLSTDMVIHSPHLKDELDSFVEKDNGQMEAEEGCFDDRVMGAAMYAVIKEKAELYAGDRSYVPARQEADPFSMEGIIEEMRSRGESELYDNQVATNLEADYADFNVIG